MPKVLCNPYWGIPHLETELAFAEDLHYGLPNLYTAGPTHSLSIHVLFYDLRLLWHAKNSTKSHATPSGFWLQTDIDWIVKWTTITQTPSLIGCKVIGCQSCQSKKVLDLLGSRLHFREIAIENLVFRRPAFESRSLQTLRASNFEKLWPTGSKATFSDRSNLYLLGLKEKKILQYFKGILC